MILNYYQESDNINTAIIGLHGWTGTEHSMVPVAKSMKISNAKWYIPRAPYNASSGKGYTWFSGSPENGWKTEKTFNLMDKLFNKIIDDGFSYNKIILLGFSMGASLSLRYGLRLDFSLKGIIPIAGYMRDTDELINTSSIKSKQTPILINALEKHKAEFGCVAVMEVKTGKIKAIANLRRIEEGLFIEDYKIGRAHV